MDDGVLSSEHLLLIRAFKAAVITPLLAAGEHQQSSSSHL